MKRLTRPEKSLQFKLLILIYIYKFSLNPDIGLHLTNRMKRKRALLRSNPAGIIRSDEHFDPL